MKAHSPNDHDITEKRDPEEKHDRSNLIIGLHDNHYRILWISADPLNETSLAGKSAFELWPQHEHEKLDAAFKMCFIHGESVGLIAEGPDFPPRDGRSALWRRTLIPIDHANMRGNGFASAMMPGLAMLSLNSRVPENYDEITGDEKELLHLLCRDNTLKQAAEVMLLSESAIDSKIKKLKQKLDVRNIGGLVAEAILRSVI